MFNKRFQSFLLLSVAMMFAATTAFADNPKINMNTFRPSPHPGDIMSIYTASQPDAWTLGGGLWLTYNYKPLRLVDNNGDALYNAIENQLIVDAQLSFNMFKFLSIAVDLPVLLWETGEKPVAGVNLEEAKGAALSDLRVGLKATLLNHEVGHGFGIAIAEDLTLPTATDTNFVGDDGLTSSTFLVLDFQKKGWQIALNAGYRYRKAVNISLTEVDDELLLGAGLVVPLMCGKLEFIGTADHRTAIDDLWGDEYKNALDLMGGLRFRAGNVTMLAAGGAGLMKGFGSPKARATINAAWEPTIDRDCCSDPDSDGICDPIDLCPTDAGTEAMGGCPDRDNDGVIDSEDACPDKAGPKELKGCPDTDNDGILDKDDECPDVAGVAEFRGCPDTDRDGVPDSTDKCPNEAGLPALDGCPDRDGDGIIDGEDKCPDKKGVAQYQGCPPPRVEVTKEKVVIREMVFFNTGKATIKQESFNLLEEVAKVLNENKQLKQVRVDGHTDNKGKPAYNLKLSQKRAESVMKFLVGKGVDKARLTAKGFGLTQPIADNGTEQGRAQNRRVEFTILSQDGK